MILIGSTVLGSWLGMQAIHESGHVIGAWLTGGKVARVVLNPLTISRTDLSHNPSPLIVVWSGPAIGTVAPLLICVMGAALSSPGAFVLRFFAGFCCLANGLYIGVGSFGQIGDCGEMLRHGSDLWQLWLFGAFTVAVGLLLWHGQSRHFGVGPAKMQIDRGVAYGSLVAFIALLILDLFIGGE
jgi:hypothetical protein